MMLFVILIYQITQKNRAVKLHTGNLNSTAFINI